MRVWPSVVSRFPWRCAMWLFDHIELRTCGFAVLVYGTLLYENPIFSMLQSELFLACYLSSLRNQTIGWFDCGLMWMLDCLSKPKEPYYYLACSLSILWNPIVYWLAWIVYETKLCVGLNVYYMTWFCECWCGWVSPNKPNGIWLVVLVSCKTNCIFSWMVLNVKVG